MAANRRVLDCYMMKQKDPILDLILQKYIQASRDTIRGPVAIKADLNIFHKSATIKRFNIPEIPEEFKLKNTILDSHSLSCFSVGGEKRLAFTELVRTVLKEINTHDIFKKRDMLLIFTSKCSQKQLDQLKYVGVLPWTSTSSDLISKSDAYRLCGALLGNLAPVNENKKFSPLSFQVYHECFGGCIGTFDPEYYTEPNSTCIMCAECKRLYSPSTFVSHNHTSYDEVHTCHWGFDSSRWRIYLMLVDEKACSDLLNVWKNVKSKYVSGYQQQFENDDPEQSQDADFVAYINSPSNKKAMVSPIETLRGQEEATPRLEKRENFSVSAFHPWSPKSPHFNSSSPVFKQKMPNFYSYPRNVDSQHLAGPSVIESPKRPKHVSCGCLPSSPAYSDCDQCRRAAFSRCDSNVSRPKEHYHDKSHMGITCTCKHCQPVEYQQQNVLESSVEDIINNFTSDDMKLKTSAKDLAKLLSSAIQQLNISHDERVREFALSNQRLQTELSLFKIESQKKLSEAHDTKAHVEYELESLHRQRQKDLMYMSRMQWDQYHSIKQVETNPSLKPKSSEISHNTLTTDEKYERKNTSSNDWIPFPSIARKIPSHGASDNLHSSSSEGAYTSHHVSVFSKVGKGSEEAQPLSPASKSRKLDSDFKSQDEDSTSEIEVED